MRFNSITYQLPLVFNALEKDESVLINPPHGFAYISHTSCETPDDDAKIPLVTEEFLGLQFNLGTQVHYRLNDRHGTVPTGCFNLLYVPPGLECEFVVERGTLSALSIQYPRQYLALLRRNFPDLLEKLFMHADGKILFTLNVCPLKCDKALKREIDAMLYLRVEPGVRREAALNSIAYDMLLYSLQTIQREFSTAPSLPIEFQKKVQRAHEYLEKHFKYDFSVDLLCAALGLDKHKLRKGFKKMYNMTMRDFVIGYRLNKAKEYLNNPDLPIGKIARLVGIKRQNYLNKLFKLKFGKTPSQERTEQIGKPGKRKKI